MTDAISATGLTGDHRKSTAFRTLLLQICSLKYPPGTILSETALGQQFSLSRTPIRQVLQQLALLGLVEPRNGIGTVVTALSDRQVSELAPIRRQLSLILPQMLGGDNYGKLADQFGALKLRNLAIKGTTDFSEFASIGLSIHEGISSLINNREFRDIWDRLYYKHCRFAFVLMNVDWERCVDLQDIELSGFIPILRSKNTDALGKYYYDVMGNWNSFASNAKNLPDELRRKQR